MCPRHVFATPPAVSHVLLHNTEAIPNAKHKAVILICAKYLVSCGMCAGSLCGTEVVCPLLTAVRRRLHLCLRDPHITNFHKQNLAHTKSGELAACSSSWDWFCCKQAVSSWPWFTLLQCVFRAPVFRGSSVLFFVSWKKQLFADVVFVASYLFLLP